MTLQLPIEVYIEILRLVPTSKASPGEPTLISCLHASTLLRAAALASSVWERPYRVRYTHSDEQRERARRDACAGDWRRMYWARRRIDLAALELLDEVRLGRAGRHERARVFTQEFGYDVWDALRGEAELPVPHWFLDAPEGEQEGQVAPPLQALPRRFWAKSVMGVIARYQVMKMWARAVNPETAHSVSFEEALAGLSAFFDRSPLEVLAELEEVCATCRERLVAHGVVLDRCQPGYNFWQLCEKIREVVHEVGFRLAEGPHFYSLMNQFPHFILQPGHRETIPISLVYVFVAVARRLGIEAAPTNFPGVVRAFIQPHDPSEPPKLMDMRGTDPPQYLTDAVSVQHAAPLLVPDEYTRPASAAAMLSRSSNNLIMFMRYERAYGQNMSSPWSLEVHESAFYAVSCWVLMDTQDEHLVPNPPESKPLDAVAVLVDGICPALEAIPRGAVSSSCYRVLEAEETQAGEAKRRSMYPKVKHFVGLMFKHARYNYMGCIFGWDPVCKQSRSWMEEMDVDALPHGRNQPFYHVLATDGHPRYVAEDNVMPTTPSKATLPWLYKCRTTFSRYFVDVDMDEATGFGRLTPSKELQDAFPEDNQYGANWIHGWVE